MLKLPRIVLDKKQKQLLILIVVLSVAAVIFYFNFLLKPQVVRVASAVVKARKMALDLKNAKTDVSKIGEFKMNIAKYQEKIERYEKLLPAEREIPNLLEGLSAMAKDSNVRILGITPIVKKKEEANRGLVYQEIPILINARSGYHELGRFLSNLENADRFMKIADLEIRANKSNPNKHDVELLVVTYTLVQ